MRYAFLENRTLFTNFMLCSIDTTMALPFFSINWNFSEMNEKKKKKWKTICRHFMCLCNCKTSVWVKLRFWLLAYMKYELELNKPSISMAQAFSGPKIALLRKYDFSKRSNNNYVEQMVKSNEWTNEYICSYCFKMWAPESILTYEVDTLCPCSVNIYMLMVVVYSVKIWQLRLTFNKFVLCTVVKCVWCSTKF